MTLFVPDVNVLLYAFREDSPHHMPSIEWLGSVLAHDRVGLADTVLSGFMRVVTHPRIFAEPTPAADAREFVQALVDSPNSEWLRQGSEAWRVFSILVAEDSGVRGNLVPDAHIARCAWRTVQRWRRAIAGSRGSRG